MLLLENFLTLSLFHLILVINMPEEFWDEFFSFQIGPFGFWAWPYRPFAVRYSRTSDSHILQIKLRPPAKKEEIKVRLVEPGLLLSLIHI